MDAFCKGLFVDRAAREIAGEMAAPEFLDRMLLCLFDALWLKQSEDWSKRGVSNMPADEPYEIANYFLKGLNVGTARGEGVASRPCCQPTASQLLGEGGG